MNKARIFLTALALALPGLAYADDDRDDRRSRNSPSFEQMVFGSIFGEHSWHRHDDRKDWRWSSHHDDRWDRRGRDRDDDDDDDDD